MEQENKKAKHLTLEKKTLIKLSKFFIFYVSPFLNFLPSSKIKLSFVHNVVGFFQFKPGKKHCFSVLSL